VTDNTSPHPAIERGEVEEDDSTSWLGLAGATVLFGGLAVALAIPSLWDSWIIENDSRRFGGILERLEDLGRFPVVGVLGLIALFALAATVHELRSNRKDS
jgi:hypothetical protein